MVWLLLSLRTGNDSNLVRICHLRKLLVEAAPHEVETPAARIKAARPHFLFGVTARIKKWDDHSSCKVSQLGNVFNLVRICHLRKARVEDAPHEVETLTGKDWNRKTSLEFWRGCPNIKMGWQFILLGLTTGNDSNLVRICHLRNLLVEAAPHKVETLAARIKAGIPHFIFEVAAQIYRLYDHSYCKIPQLEIV
jgi:hypothetical protein